MKIIKKILVFVLIFEAKLILRKYKPSIIAITGSVGKTSTKDAIYSVVKKQAKFARKSEKSLNSEIGLPLTIIGVPNAWRSIGGWLSNIFKGLELIIWREEYPDVLVLEVGADHPGDIESVAKWLNPDIAIITKVGDTPVHVEFFSSPDEVFKEKSYLAYGLKKSGTLILFADEPRVMTLSDWARANNIRVISFGTKDFADIKASNYTLNYEDEKLSGFMVDITVNGEKNILKIDGVVGDAYVYSLLAACAVGFIRNIVVKDIVDGLKNYVPPRGRLNLIDGLNKSLIIDDSYNSSPDAVDSALNTLKLVKAKGRKIAVLGDMMELGQYSTEEHRKVGAKVIGISDILVTVGPRSETSLVKEAKEKGMAENNVKSFASSIEAGEYLRGVVGSGDAILVKGSQSMRMERVVKTLMNEPTRASELLVRQEKEWLEKK